MYDLISHDIIFEDTYTHELWNYWRAGFIGRESVRTLVLQRELMGVASNSWFDTCLLSTLYMFKPSCRPMFKPPSLGPP